MGMDRIIRLALLPALCLLATVTHADDGCRDQRLLPDFEARDLEFGVDVAINDRHLIVVDRYAKTYAYRRDDASGEWAFLQSLPAASGGAVELDGDRVVLGSLGVERYGGAVVFAFDGTAWYEEGRLESPEDPRYSPSGEHVTLYRDTAAFANWGTMVRVFRVEGGDWQPLAEIRAPVGQIGGPGFGNAMAMDDRFFVVGAPVERLTGGLNGAVYVYAWDADGLPVFVQKLEPVPQPSGPRLGTALAVQDATLVVGAPTTTLDGFKHGVGSVLIYEHDGMQWSPVQELFAPAPQSTASFGVDVALDGDLLAIGARGEFTPGATGNGTAHLYRRGPDGVWRHEAQVGQMGLPGVDYAEAVALGGGQMVVGGSEAYVSGRDQGVADVYDLDCLRCTPDLDADGELTFFDVLLFFNAFEAGDPIADFDGDGEFTIIDFTIFQQVFDAGCG